MMMLLRLLRRQATIGIIVLVIGLVTYSACCKLQSTFFNNGNDQEESKDIEEDLSKIVNQKVDEDDIMDRKTLNVNISVVGESFSKNISLGNKGRPFQKVEVEVDRLDQHNGSYDDMSETYSEDDIRKSEPFGDLKHISPIYDQITQNVDLRAGNRLDEILDAATGAVPGRKNVLFIMSDDLRPQMGSYWGPNYPNPNTNMVPHTPHLDKLASRSMVLTRAYVQFPLCGPSRASLLTGRRPDTTNTWSLETKFRYTLSYPIHHN